MNRCPSCRAPADPSADAFAVYREAVGALKSERDELRLTLAAEQGKAEGAPSEGWAFVGGVWKKGNFSVWSDADGWDILWFNGGVSKEIGTYTTARAAMIAADAANPKE